MGWVVNRLWVLGTISPPAAERRQNPPPAESLRLPQDISKPVGSRSPLGRAMSNNTLTEDAAEGDEAEHLFLRLSQRYIADVLLVVFQAARRRCERVASPPVLDMFTPQLHDVIPGVYGTFSAQFAFHVKRSMG